MGIFPSQHVICRGLIMSVMWASTYETEVQMHCRCGSGLAAAQCGHPEKLGLVPSGSVRKKPKELIQPDWRDIPDWNTSLSPLMEMPLEVLDKVHGIWLVLLPADLHYESLDFWNWKRSCGSFYRV
jgi:hypothetical protein